LKAEAPSWTQQQKIPSQKKVGKIRLPSRRSPIAREHRQMPGILIVDPMEATVMHVQTSGRDLRRLVEVPGTDVIPAVVHRSFVTAKAPPIKGGPTDTAARERTEAGRTKSPVGHGGLREAGNVDVMMNAIRREDKAVVIIGQEAIGMDLLQRRKMTRRKISAGLPAEKTRREFIQRSPISPSHP
jgi:hypothetical protein